MRRRAFTLIEMTLALLILALILALALPDLGSVWRRRSLVESADRLRSLIVMTHARAMQDGRKYRIWFEGAPDPNDPLADKVVDIPFQTLQPNIERQADPLSNPDAYEGVQADWTRDPVLQEGTRCVAVYPGKPNFDISTRSPIAGPSITEDKAPFHRPTFNPDGTADWVTFVLTDLPVEYEPTADDVGRIINVVVDGRTGQAWLQRALRVEEVELMRERRAEPVLHMDFTRTDLITEQNILEVHYSQDGRAGGGGSRRRQP